MLSTSRQWISHTMQSEELSHTTVSCSGYKHQAMRGQKGESFHTEVSNNSVTALHDGAVQKCTGTCTVNLN